MLSLKTSQYLHRPSAHLKSLLSPSRSRPAPPLLFSPRPFPRSLPLFLSSATGKMASAAAGYGATATSTAAGVVEHVVLFKVRDATDPSKIESMVSNLLSLVTLPGVAHLAAGPILRQRSAAAIAAGFTHVLHSRYASKPDLAAYAANPAHVAVVKEFVQPICDDIMAFDWIAEGIDAAAAPIPTGSAVRLTLAKPKEGAAAAEILAALELEGVEKSVPAVRQVSYGENFSPARAKGYGVGFISVFPGMGEVDAMEKDAGDVLEAQKARVRPLLDSVIVVDFEVPPPPSSL